MSEPSASEERIRKEERERVAKIVDALSESWLEAASQAYMARRKKRRVECANKSLALKEAVREIRGGARGEE